MRVPEDDATPEESARAAKLKERQVGLSEALARATEHYRAQLKASPRAIDYLKHRGLSGEIAARFGLGYAPDGWRSLASVFARYDDPLLEECGLVIAQGDDEADRKRYDRFRDRIMFPIRSVQGDVIGFGGRVIDQGEPKYLNSPETPVFSKGRELYGLHEARQALRQQGLRAGRRGLHGRGCPCATRFSECRRDARHGLHRRACAEAASGSPIRSSSASTAMPPAAGRQAGRWRRRCRMRATRARSASCFCRPSTIPTLTSASTAAMHSSAASSRPCRCRAN